LEEGDPGVWDRGTPTKKMVHQLSSTSDPVLNLKVPANRIIGGYTIKDGVIVPNYNHGDVIEAVFSHTRVTVGLMTSAKLLSAIEPIIRYHRSRFRGGQGVVPGSPRYDLGIQQKEDALHRLIDIWATGEASSSMGFECARVFDVLDPLEKVKDRLLKEQGVEGSRAQMRALMKVGKEAIEMIELAAQPAAKRDGKRLAALQGNQLVQFVVTDALANVLCPAVKLWNTGIGATMMREAVSLMGGYGITEDCPGFLGQKWMDTQLEATYEGPEVVQRRQLSATMTSEVFLAQLRAWADELRAIAKTHPQIGACGLANAIDLWLWTLKYAQTAKDGQGEKLYQSARHGVSFNLADALCWLLAVRSLIADVIELETKGAEVPTLAEGFDGLILFYSDLCAVQSARAAGEAVRICTDLVYGYRASEECCASEGGCCGKDKKDDSLSAFASLRAKVDGCLAGSRLAKDRAADAASKVMIPEALDYPV
ncbi:MAG: acyl-CoA dehydrogenase, partial [Vicinamibacteria bacterium]|nr:acyl-CoA dehydrogenase [Vicinamibacteria bacterium]